MSSRDYSKYPLDDLISSGVVRDRFAYDHFEDFRAILKKFTKVKLKSEVLEMCGLDLDLSGHNARLDKEQIIEYIIKVAKQESMDVEELTTLLKLKYCQDHVTSRQWCVLEVKNAENLIDRDTPPETFAVKLKKYLNKSQLSCQVTSQVDEDTMWTIISIRKLQSKPDILFLLSYPHLPFVLHSSIKATLQDAIHRGLIQLFQGTAVEKLPIKSKNVETLVLFGYQKSACDVDPTLLPAIIRKKERMTVEEPILPANVIVEDYKEELARKAYIEKAFGPYTQPAIEALTYVVTSDFYGFDDDDEPPIPVVCQAVFKGRNTLEGIQQLVKLGVGDYPLPGHMVNVPDTACNKFRIKIKRRRTEYTEQSRSIRS